MKVYICGYAGNMGKRYRAILEWMGHHWSGYDPFAGYSERNKSNLELSFSPDEADRILICTPTISHISDIRDFLEYEKPILCEKPICKDKGGLRDLLSDVGNSKVLLEMVNQYEHMPFPREREGLTEYDYFKSGGDGRAWDCINIISQARGAILIGNKSPVWRCSINGERLNIADMDTAYIENIATWLTNPTDGIEYIWKAHERIFDLLERENG